MANLRNMTSVRPGAPVMTADGKELGKVKDTREDQLLVDVRWRPDYWLGIESVEDLSPDLVQLSIVKSEVGQAKLPDIKSISTPDMPPQQ